MSKDEIFPNVNPLAVEKVSSPETASIHPDLEKGVEALLKGDISKAVAGGYSAVGLNVAAANLRELLKSQNAAINAEGQKEVLESIKQELEKNIALGLKNALAELVRRTEKGWRLGLQDHIYGEIKNLCLLAKESGININFIPEPGNQGSGQELLAPIRNEEEIIAYCNDIVGRHMLSWFPGRLDTFKYEVESGGAKFESFDEEVKEWLARMEQIGFKIIKTPREISGAEVAKRGFASEGLLRREIHEADVWGLKDEIIMTNLAKGVEGRMGMIKYSVSAGSSDPLKWEGDIKMILKEAEKRGLIAKESPTLIAQDGKINPNLIEPTIAKIVRENIKTGIEKINETFANYIRHADLGLLDFNRNLLEDFIELAKKYEVTIEDPDALRKNGQAMISAENIQEGIKEILAFAVGRARAGDMNLLRHMVTVTTKMKKLAHENGLDNDVDFTALDKYFDDLKVDRPQLK